MKKMFLFAVAFCAALTLNAQTIEIDGDNADWAEVPMLSNPGATPIFKMVVPQTGLTLPTGAAICVMVERTAAETTTYPGLPVTYVDADKNVATTAAGNAWYCPSFGPDYEMGPWDGNDGASSSDGTIGEVIIVQSTFTGIPFTGDCYAYMLFNWAKYMPNSPEDNAIGTEWKWSENSYHPIIVKPYTYANLNGTHAAVDIYSSHEALTPASSLNMAVAGSANDVELWASWAVELTNPAKYDIKADISSTNTASVDLKLVNVATNAVVATFASSDLAEGAEVAVGEWDLSAVPAGKYMLRFSNHVEWSEMKLNSLTLTAQGGSGVENVNSNVQATKVIRDGQVLIVRDGKTFNALGAEVK